jgi:hypothetical protein
MVKLVKCDACGQRHPQFFCDECGKRGENGDFTFLDVRLPTNGAMSIQIFLCPGECTRARLPMLDRMIEEAKRPR